MRPLSFRPPATTRLAVDPALRAGPSPGGSRGYFFSVRIQVTRSLMSASGTCAFGGIGIWPQTPTPPFLTLSTSLATAPASPLYLAETSIYGGPTSFLSMVWQAAQPSFFIIASAVVLSSAAWAPPATSRPAAKTKHWRFMQSPWNSREVGHYRTGMASVTPSAALSARLQAPRRSRRGLPTAADM